MADLSVEGKKELIYTGERFKEIALEMHQMLEEKKKLENISDLSDMERRRRVYTIERIKRLKGEKEELHKVRQRLAI
ncbi:hypothetical protein ERD78_06135 [Allopusillimonas soli]|uniref:Uncharacterized protein n=1 Tax=Allopusillimonas soli TaxID=659016 RepID=A0A853FEH6_9BURK|nr:hypothetical protein [Allopusillimonas soli]NYT36446.1 hypothetical protein [Allopusillimonas soli]TEA74955.1 hypothetical protein ERD78_06135 [Allopusillimonas soli]